MDNTRLEAMLLSMDENTSLRDLQKYIDTMVNARGWAEETPQDTLLLLTEELGELAKEVRKAHTKIQTDQDSRGCEDLKGEAADVFLMLLALCRTLDIDLLQAFVDKEIKNCHRNWG